MTSPKSAVFSSELDPMRDDRLFPCIDFGVFPEGFQCHALRGFHEDDRFVRRRVPLDGGVSADFREELSGNGQGQTHLASCSFCEGASMGDDEVFVVGLITGRTVRLRGRL